MENIIQSQRKESLKSINELGKKDIMPVSLLLPLLRDVKNFE